MTEVQKRAAVVAEARSWVAAKTPFGHRGMAKGVAVDCVGLVIMAGTAAGVLDLTDEAWAPFAKYGRLPSPEFMQGALAALMVPIAEDDMLSGDVGFFAWGDPRFPSHLAIMGMFDGRRTMIHAYGIPPGGKLGSIPQCLEHGFAPPWTQRLVSFWRYPGLAT